MDGDSGSANVSPRQPHRLRDRRRTTDLAKYDKAIECKLGTTTVASVHGRKPVRRAGGLQRDGDLHDHQHAPHRARSRWSRSSIPTTDPGLLRPQGRRPTVKADAVDGDSGSPTSAPAPTRSPRPEPAPPTSPSTTRRSSASVGSGHRAPRSAGELNAGDSNDVTCTITNTRTGLDPGRQGSDPRHRHGPLRPQGRRTTVKAGALTATPAPPPTSRPDTYTVSEAGGRGTDLGKYDKSVECSGPTASRRTRAQPRSGVTVDSDETVICTITNTRSQGTIQVVKDWSPTTDPGLVRPQGRRPTVKADAVRRRLRLTATSPRQLHGLRGRAGTHRPRQVRHVDRVQAGHDYRDLARASRLECR